MKHPFKFEFESQPGRNAAHEVQWACPARVELAQVQVYSSIPTAMLVHVAGIHVPGGPVWVSNHTTVSPATPVIECGQVVRIESAHPFSACVQGVTSSLPGRLPPGLWLAYPNRAGDVDYLGYRRVRRVHGLQEGDTTVVVSDGQKVAVDPRGDLATPVIVGVGGWMRREGAPLTAPTLTMIGDTIVNAVSASIVGDHLAGATCFQVDEAGNEVAFTIPRLALEAIQAARAEVRASVERMAMGSAALDQALD